MMPDAAYFFDHSAKYTANTEKDNSTAVGGKRPAEQGEAGLPGAGKPSKAQNYSARSSKVLVSDTPQNLTKYNRRTNIIICSKQLSTTTLLSSIVSVKKIYAGLFSTTVMTAL